MPTTDELMAAPKSTVVEPGAQLGRTPMWELFHYEHGKPAGRSIARHQDLHEWLGDLEAAGRLIGFGWELRGQGAPDDWPGWPIPDAAPAAPLEGAARDAATRLITRPARRDVDDREGDDQ